MDTLWQSIIGNLIADIILFGGAALFSLLWLKLKNKFGKIGKNLKASPDAKSFTSEIDGDVYITDIHGTRNITHSNATESGVVWSGNSRLLAYGRKEVNGWQVIVHDLDTDKKVCLSEGYGDARPVEWNVSGDLIVKLGGSFLTIYRQEIEKRLR